MNFQISSQAYDPYPQATIEDQLLQLPFDPTIAFDPTLGPTPDPAGMLQMDAGAWDWDWYTYSGGAPSMYQPAMQTDGMLAQATHCGDFSYETVESEVEAEAGMEQRMSLVEEQVSGSQDRISGCEERIVRIEETLQVLEAQFVFTARGLEDANAL
jgi:hypothetical protein